LKNFKCILNTFYVVLIYGKRTRLFAENSMGLPYSSQKI